MDIAPTDSTADTESAAPAPPLDDTSDSPPTDAPRRPGRIVSMLAGFVSAATALAVAEALTVLARSWRSPVLDVGDRMVDIMASYPKVKQTAVDVLGNADKPALLLGIGALLTVYSLILGWVALRRSLLVGELMVGLFAVIGVWAALGRASDGSLFSALPTVIGAIAGVLVLRFLAGALQPRPANAGGPDAAAGDGTDRRRFIGRSVVLLGGVAAAAALVGVGGRQVASRRFSAAGSRKNVTIPTAEEPLGPVPAGAQAPVDGMTPFITPNGDFYRVDTALEVPQLTTDGYTLKVKGMVDNAMELSWNDLLNRPMIERDITMTCVSNTVGGHYVGTARWIGARLDDLLREAGVQPDADMVVGRSSDGFECGFPVANAMDGRDAIIAVAMNGEPLPLAARLPGAPRRARALRVRVRHQVAHRDRAHPLRSVRALLGAPRVGGEGADQADEPHRRSAGASPTCRPARSPSVAWRGPRRSASPRSRYRSTTATGPRRRLADQDTVDTWRQWSYAWDATSGNHSLRVRATDQAGELQTDERADPIPDGASGWHQILVLVD